MEMTNAYTVLFVAPRRRWEYIIKMDRVELVFVGVNLVEMSRHKVPLQDSVNTVTTFGFINAGSSLMEGEA
jgi:hypothetical protein